MTKEKRIACFFSCGHTELNSMRLFLKKINNGARFIQKCPNGVRKSKKEIQTRRLQGIPAQQNGMTGEQLIDYVLNCLSSTSFVQEQYDAILIEDDRDNRFLRLLPDGLSVIDYELWEQHKAEIEHKIHELIPNVPVVLFYAAPEVEMWFLADWDNSFGYAYHKLTGQENQHFSTIFRRYVNKNVLTNQCSDNLENYGCINGTYRKLSDELIAALENVDLSECSIPRESIRYSKRSNGPIMLENIDPETVQKKCTCFFRYGMYQLKNLE